MIWSERGENQRWNSKQRDIAAKREGEIKRVDHERGREKESKEGKR